MGCARNSPSHVGLRGRLVFWFRLFFWLPWDGESGFFCPCSMSRHVDVDGMRMGSILATQFLCQAGTTDLHNGYWAQDSGRNW